MNNNALIDAIRKKRMSRMDAERQYRRTFPPTGDMPRKPGPNADTTTKAQWLLYWQRKAAQAKRRYQ